MESKQSQGYRRVAGLDNLEEGVAASQAVVSGESQREILVLEVECGSRAPAVVREALKKIEGLGPARDDLVLVASELVSNAVVHSGGTPADTIKVRAVLIPGAVLISVHDPGLSGDSPRVRDLELPGDGWGLQIVTVLAHRWGFERDRGHRVWAELCLPSAATAPGRGG